MEEYLGEEWNEWEEGGEDASSGDPFEGLTAREQDVFFRVLDLIPDEQRETAIEYFMDHPAKIHAVVDTVKTKKEMIKNKDAEGLKKLFEEEHIVIEKVDEMQPATEEIE